MGILFWDPNESGSKSPDSPTVIEIDSGNEVEDCSSYSGKPISEADLTGDDEQAFYNSLLELNEL